MALEDLHLRPVVLREPLSHGDNPPPLRQEGATLDENGALREGHQAAQVRQELGARLSLLEVVEE